MSTEQTKQKKLLDALWQIELIKAVIIVDDKGRLKGRRGHARALRSAPSEPASASGVHDKTNKENIYLTSLKSGDFVIVVFETHIHFDSLKKEIDELVHLWEAG